MIVYNLAMFYYSYPGLSYKKFRISASYGPSIVLDNVNDHIWFAIVSRRVGRTDVSW